MPAPIANLAERLPMAWEVNTEEPSPPRGVSRVRLAVSALALLALALVALTLLQQQWVPKQVISNSMYPTLETGEYVLVDCRAHRDFARGAVVMFPDPTKPDEYVVKRIVATAGDTVVWEDGRLKVNGDELRQIEPDNLPPKWEGAFVRGMPHRRSARWRVGREEVFVLGDNWGNSHDSFDYGPVRVSALLGIARCVYWPPNRIRAIR